MPEDLERIQPKRETRCPTCDAEIRGNRQERPHFPYCSHRCRQIDLGR
ncbi:MAG TPA: DNA gyrase inhibitor YacG [Gemmataceae bacterium]|nr:DNA gyrase inhibitor YacG [Gemmataceae bacterium]